MRLVTPIESVSTLAAGIAIGAVFALALTTSESTRSASVPTLGAVATSVADGASRPVPPAAMPVVARAVPAAGMRAEPARDSATPLQPGSPPIVDTISQWLASDLQPMAPCWAISFMASDC